MNPTPAASRIYDAVVGHGMKVIKVQPPDGFVVVDDRSGSVYQVMVYEQAR